MTKKLTNQEKKKRKEIRKQQKAKSKTVKTITQPKPTEPPSPPADQGPPSPVNLCDDCAYEFGECEGVPKFAQEEGADDRVVECPAFVNVASMPTADQGKKEPPGPAAAEAEKPWDIALKRLDEFGQAQLNARADEIRELAEAEINLRFAPGTEPTAEERAEVLVHIVQETIKREGGPTDGLVHALEKEGATEEGKAEDLAVMEADLEARRKKTQRFYQEEDFGTCQSCQQPLKRTALNRDRDAIRCVNGHCNQYRFIIRTISTGV